MISPENTMSETKRAAFAYPRLCLAYFCQFAIWGAWAGALGGYAGGILKLPGSEIGSLYNAIPFGAVIAPLFIGPIADRFFSAQKVIAFLHFIGGAALLACGWLCLQELQTFPVLMGLMLLSGMCFMPTIGLVNSVVFKHLPKPSMGPYVFVFGTIGWIVVNLFIAGFCGGAETPNFFFVGGGISVFLALYSLTLPDTPPKGAPAPGEKSDALGLGALSLFKDFSFAIFVFCAFFASIPACNYFFPSQVLYLSERGYPSPVALTTINQFSEIIFMTALPFFIGFIGLKRVLLIGMLAWVVRYLCFTQPAFAFAFAGLLLHGFCYSFLYVAAYMYADKKAPENLKASAQSMMIFLLLGVGQVCGGYSFAYMWDKFPPQHSGVVVATDQIDDFWSKDAPVVVSGEVKVGLPVWSDDADSPLQYLDLAAQVEKYLATEKKEETAAPKKRSVNLGKLLSKNPLTPQAIDALTDDQLVQDDAPLTYWNINAKGATVSLYSDGKPFSYLDPAPKRTVHFTKADLKKTAASIAGDENFSLTRQDWLAAQAHDWKMIFAIPAAFIGVFFVIFLLLGRDPDADAKKKEQAAT